MSGREVIVTRPDGTPDLWLYDVWPATGAPQRGTVMTGGWYWRRDGVSETSYATAAGRDAGTAPKTCWIRPELHWFGLRYSTPRTTDDTIAF